MGKGGSKGKKERVEGKRDNKNERVKRECESGVEGRGDSRKKYG